MTICSKMYEALDKRLEEKKTLDEIGSELCDAVIDPRGKAIRLIKQSKGEKYLKDNAEWLKYHEGMKNNPDGSNQFDQKNSVKSKEQQEHQDLLGDARSNGMQTSTPQRIEPSSTSMQSMQDEFEPEEIVYEKSTTGTVCSLNNNPHTEEIHDIKGMCPCGCGYRYDEENTEWYNENNELITMVAVNVKRETYERLLRRRKDPDEKLDVIVNRILDGDIHEQPR